jgi:hypothetical protein
MTWYDRGIPKAAFLGTTIPGRNMMKDVLEIQKQDQRHGVNPSVLPAESSTAREN